MHRTEQLTALLVAVNLCAGLFVAAGMVDEAEGLGAEYVLASSANGLPLTPTTVFPGSDEGERPSAGSSPSGVRTPGLPPISLPTTTTTAPPPPPSTTTTTAPPPPPPVNLAPNPSFESDPSSAYATHGKGAFSWIQGTSQAGARSVRIDSDRPNNSLARWFSRMEEIPATPGEVYDASVYLKVRDVTNRAELALNFWDEDKQHLGTTKSTSVEGTRGWTPIALSATAPEGTRSLRVEFRLYGSGTVWTDAVTVTAPNGGPPGTLPAGDSSTSTAEARLVNDPNTLWMGTFDNQPWDANFGIAGWGAYKENFSVTTPSVASQGRVMRAHFTGCPDGGPPDFDSNVCRRGVEFRSLFPKMGFSGQDEAYFRYYVYFPENFDFVDVGKLPGLAGTTTPDNVMNISGGGDYHPSTWSGRIMWERGGVTSYLYVKHAAGKNIEDNVAKNGHLYGLGPDWFVNADRTKPRLMFQTGAWNVIELHYKLNTPGQNNGVFRGWLNGTLGVDLRDVQYRTADYPNLDINMLFNVTHYGGPYGPTSPQYAYFDDYAISKTYVGSRR